MDKHKGFFSKIRKFTDRTDEEEELQIDRDPVKDILERKLMELIAQKDSYYDSDESETAATPAADPGSLPERPARFSDDPLLMMLNDPYGSTKENIPPEDLSVRSSSRPPEMPSEHGFTEQPPEKPEEIMTEAQPGLAAAGPMSDPEVKPVVNSLSHSQPVINSPSAVQGPASGEKASSPDDNPQDKKGGLNDLMDIFCHEEKEDKGPLTEDLDNVDIISLMDDAMEVLDMLRKQRGR